MSQIKKVAINGFGRIGRLAFRRMFGDKEIEIVAINDLTSPKTLAHLLKYDSAHKGFHESDIQYSENSITVQGKKIPIFTKKDPKELPWGELNVDIVVESTGFFTSKEAANAHIIAGAKKVLISAPATGDLKTIVYSVNHKTLSPEDTIISAGSCTTNCLGLVADVIDREFEIIQGQMLTVHAYTNDQRIQDAPHSDLRRARAAAVSIIPASTGAAKAIGAVCPSLKGKLDGMAMRVPTITGSVVYLTVQFKANPTVEEINNAIKKAANDSLKYNVDEIVSSDIIGSTYGSIFDATLTKKLDKGNLYQIVTWYDNEMSYVSQFVRTLKHLAKI